MNHQIPAGNGTITNYKVRLGRSIRPERAQTFEAPLGGAVPQSAQSAHVHSSMFQLPGMQHIPYVASRLERIELSMRVDKRFASQIGIRVLMVIGHYANGKIVTKVVDENTPETATLGLPLCI